MTQIRNPHPGEILKEEFLKEIGMSQNGLAHAIGVPGNRIHAIVNGMRDITGDTDLRLCKFFGLSEGYSCGCKMPMTRWKRNAESRPMSPRSNPTDRKRLPNALTARPCRPALPGVKLRTSRSCCASPTESNQAE
jgi:antitoxin HigA-1